MNHSSKMLSAERHSQSNLLPIQNQETRGENSHEIYERNPTRIQAQTGSASVSEGGQNPRTARQSVLGKRNASDMPTGERTSIMRPATTMSSQRRNPLSSMSVLEQQMLQPFEAQASHQPFQMRMQEPSSSNVMYQLVSNSNQAAVPLGVSDRCQNLWQPQTGPNPYYSMFPYSGQPAYPGNQTVVADQFQAQKSKFHDDNSAVNVVNPTNIAGSSQHILQLQPLSIRAEEEIMHQFQVQRAAAQANDPVIGRLSSLVAVTQRHGFDKGKQQMMDQVPHRNLVLSGTYPLVAWRLHQSSATSQTMPHSSSSATLRTIQFIRGHGPTEARRTLELMTRAGEEMSECRIVYGDGTEGVSCFTIPSKIQAHMFTGQFSALMASEGFTLADPQFNDFIEVVEERLLRLEISESRQSDLATYATVQEMMEPSLSLWRPRPQYVVMQLGFQRRSQLLVDVDPQVGLFPSPSTSLTPNQADLSFPWLLTIAGNPTLRVPVLVPYASQVHSVVVGPSGALLATPIRLPPIPCDIVVPVQTPLIIPRRAAARLVTLAAGESNSGQLMQLLPWILNIID